MSLKEILQNDDYVYQKLITDISKNTSVKYWIFFQFLQTTFPSKWSMFFFSLPLLNKTFIWISFWMDHFSVNRYTHTCFGNWETWVANTSVDSPTMTFCYLSIYCNNLHKICFTWNSLPESKISLWWIHTKQNIEIAGTSRPGEGDCHMSGPAVLPIGLIVH